MASASLLLLLATATAATFSPSRCLSGCGPSPALASFSDARTRITSSYNNYNSINNQRGVSYSNNNHNSYSSYGQTRPAAPSPSPAWAEVVPSKLASVPGQVASIRWVDNI